MPSAKPARGRGQIPAFAISSGKPGRRRPPFSLRDIGELRRGVELIHHRGDLDQAAVLKTWLAMLLEQYGSSVLDFDADAAQIWVRLRIPNPQNELDKQIGAIALVNDLTVVT